MSKILDINFHLQQPNMVFKYLEIDVQGKYLKTAKPLEEANLISYTNWCLELWFYPTVTNDGTIRAILGNTPKFTSGTIGRKDFDLHVDEVLMMK